jgi:hypothetical protein
VHLRLHRFWRGDDDRAPHDHPWPFITVPFTSYVEAVYEPYGVTVYRKVTRFLPHFRRALFRHIVIGPCDWTYLIEHHVNKKQVPCQPFWTFVVALQQKRLWGFWPRNSKFVPNGEWDAYNAGVDKQNW